MNHYVYEITDPQTKQYYIGVRTCNCDPKDDNYMGSYNTWEPEDESRLEKEIIKSDFVSREEANKYEIKLIKRHIKNKFNENYHFVNNFHARLGEEHHNTNFTKDQVLKIKYNFDLSDRQLAKKYDVGRKTISNIKNGVTWQWLIDQSKEEYRKEKIKERRNNKLPKDIVLKIKYNFKDSRENIAKKYNIKRGRVTSIQNNRYYKNIIIPEKEEKRKLWCKYYKRGSKLTPIQILDIKYNFEKSREELANKYNMTVTNISVIQRNESYKEIIIPKKEEKRKKYIKSFRRGNSSKINSQKARKIKYYEGDKSIKDIAKLFNTTYSVVYNIRKGNTWKNI